MPDEVKRQIIHQLSPEQAYHRGYYDGVTKIMEVFEEQIQLAQASRPIQISIPSADPFAELRKKIVDDWKLVACIPAGYTPDDYIVGYDAALKKVLSLIDE